MHGCGAPSSMWSLTPPCCSSTPCPGRAAPAGRRRSV